MPVFIRSIFRFDCEECGRQFTAGRGGVCVSCRRKLCFRDLHGNVFRHLLVYFGVHSQCVACRRDGPEAVLARMAESDAGSR